MLNKFWKVVKKWLIYLALRLLVAAAEMRIFAVSMRYIVFKYQLFKKSRGCFVVVGGGHFQP